MNTAFPLGIDNFEKLRSGAYYYVDKTLFIYELLSKQFEANLITRPRRFGKTLTMSMLDDFFDISRDSRERFEGLKISENVRLCEEWMNQWPTVFITLKSVEGLDFEGAYGMLVVLIASMCKKYAFLEQSGRVDSADKEIFGQLKSQRASKENLKDSLVLLTRMMSAHYGKQVILLVDEYDVPLAKASENGYYTEMMDVLRALLGGALKTNEFLKFAVITGCLKIVKESIFTGINNLVADTITGGRFEEYFGFSEADVEKMLRDTGLTEYASVFKEWYDGYRFGEVDVYCPWDVLNYANALQDDAHAQPQAYWANTSGNYILRSFLRRASRTTKKEIEALISGETVTQKISEQLTYNELDKNISNLWSVLYMTGYLTAKGKTTDGRLDLCIPNREIWEIFSLQIQDWFEEDVVKKEAAAYEAFCQAFAEGKAQEIENEFNRFLLKSISIGQQHLRNLQEYRKS